MLSKKEFIQLKTAILAMRNPSSNYKPACYKEDVIKLLSEFTEE